MYHLHKYASAVAVLVALQWLPLCVLGMAAAPSPELSFYRAIPSREIGSRDPAGYDRVILPPGSESREVFVERKPAVTFSTKEMPSAMGHRTETSEALNRIVEESMRQRGRKDLPSKEEPEDFTLTITFSEEAAARFKEFTKEHDREMFDLRLGGERLNVGRLYGPFPGSTFSTRGLSREMLTRLKSKFPGLIKLEIK